MKKTHYNPRHSKDNHSSTTMDVLIHSQEYHRNTSDNNDNNAFDGRTRNASPMTMHYALNTPISSSTSYSYNNDATTMHPTTTKTKNTSNSNTRSSFNDKYNINDASSTVYPKDATSTVGIASTPYHNSQSQPHQSTSMHPEIKHPKHIYTENAPKITNRETKTIALTCESTLPIVKLSSTAIQDMINQSPPSQDEYQYPLLFQTITNTHTTMHPPRTTRRPNPELFLFRLLQPSDESAFATNDDTGAISYLNELSMDTSNPNAITNELRLQHGEMATTLCPALNLFYYKTSSEKHTNGKDRYQKVCTSLKKRNLHQPPQEVTASNTHNINNVLSLLLPQYILSIMDYDDDKSTSSKHNRQHEAYHKNKNQRKLTILVEALVPQIQIDTHTILSSFSIQTIPHPNIHWQRDLDDTYYIGTLSFGFMTASSLKDDARFGIWITPRGGETLVVPLQQNPFLYTIFLVYTLLQSEPCSSFLLCVSFDTTSGVRQDTNGGIWYQIQPNQTRHPQLPSHDRSNSSNRYSMKWNILDYQTEIEIPNSTTTPLRQQPLETNFNVSNTIYCQFKHTLQQPSSYHDNENDAFLHEILISLHPYRRNNTFPKQQNQHQQNAPSPLPYHTTTQKDWIVKRQQQQIQEMKKEINQLKNHLELSSSSSSTKQEEDKTDITYIHTEDETTTKNDDDNVVRILEEDKRKLFFHESSMLLSPILSAGSNTTFSLSPFTASINTPTPTPSTRSNHYKDSKELEGSKHVNDFDCYSIENEIMNDDEMEDDDDSIIKRLEQKYL